MNQRIGPWVPALLLLVGGAGCSLDGLFKSEELPPDVNDPAVTQTPMGAEAAYYGAVSQFRETFGGHTSSFLVVSGLLTDELVTNGSGSAANRRLLALAPSTDGLYGSLHKIRNQTRQAIALLTRHLPEQPALAGRLYALQGYAETFLAELYCSGIPLSTLDYESDFTYQPGSTTVQVLAHAVALFDTALGLAADSARFMDLARVGRARALVGLGEYASAAAGIATVADGFRYEVSFTSTAAAADTNLTAHNFAFTVGGGATAWRWSVPDREGVNGMNWRTSEDPRLAGFTVVDTTRGIVDNGSHDWILYHPNKYATDGASPIVLASGVEARLIAAEAALDAGDGGWLTTLNALRTDGTFSGVDTQVVSVDTMVDNTVDPPDTTYDTTFAYDTLWNAGSGGVNDLAPLADPGTAEGRVDLLFRERAFWLFLTGQRQGDLRRLIRQYGRLEFELYPVGLYQDTALLYGPDVTLPVPQSEREVNPLYDGCFSRAA